MIERILNKDHLVVLPKSEPMPLPHHQKLYRDILDKGTCNHYKNKISITRDDQGNRIIYFNGKI